jgi:hypothetical protein
MQMDSLLPSAAGICAVLTAITTGGQGGFLKMNNKGELRPFGQIFLVDNSVLDW